MEVKIKCWCRLIANDKAGDREAMAHETGVVIPGDCRFLIADIKDFKLLLPGDSLEVLSPDDPSCKRQQVKT